MKAGQHRGDAQEESRLKLLDAPEMTPAGQGTGQPGFMLTYAMEDRAVQTSKALYSMGRWRHG